MVLLAVAFPSSLTFLRLALDKLPLPRSSHAQRLETGAQGKYLNPNLNPASAGHPPLGRPARAAPTPPALPVPLREGGKVLYINIYIFQGRNGAWVLNPNKPLGLVLGTLPGIWLPSSGASWKLD